MAYEYLDGYTQTQLENVINVSLDPAEKAAAEEELDFAKALEAWADDVVNRSKMGGRRGFDTPPPPPVI